MNRHNKKTLVIFNPVAGQFDNKMVRRKIGEVMNTHHIPHDVHETAQGEDLHKSIRTALDEGYEQLLAVGGDGTVSGVASGLTNTQIPVIIIPTGTSNALAKILEIPLQLDDAIDWWLSTHKTKTVDTMKVDNRYYLLNISIGASSVALTNVDRKEKRRFGSLVYLIKGVKSLAGISPYKFRFSIDGRDFDCLASEMIVANSGISQFRPLQLNPNILIDDGILSVCTIKAASILDYLRVAGEIVSGRPKGQHRLRCRDAQDQITIQTNRPLPVQADGEIIGLTPVSVKLNPGGVDFLIPENKV